MTSSVIINKETTKFNSLVGLKCMPSTGSNKHVSFMTSDTVPSKARKGGPGTMKISEWRKKEIRKRPVIERDGKV